MDSKLLIEIAIAVILLIALIIYCAWQIKKRGLKTAIVDLIVYAEGNIQNNEDKFNYVVDRVISLIPMPFNLFVTEEMVGALVQKTFDLVKKALDYKPE